MAEALRSGSPQQHSQQRRPGPKGPSGHANVLIKRRVVRAVSTLCRESPRSLKRSRVDSDAELEGSRIRAKLAAPSATG
jgi:hypothetical protein